MLQLGTFSQICWVVADLEEAMQRWHRTTGVGPFHILRSPQIGNFQYRGSPGSLDMDVALAQAGAIQIEFIHPKSHTPSAYRDAWAPGGEVMHHMGRITDDFDADVAHYSSNGFEVAQSGLSATKRFAYFDTRNALGFMVELIERDAALDAMFEMIADASINWNGEDPYREIALG